LKKWQNQVEAAVKWELEPDPRNRRVHTSGMTSFYDVDLGKECVFQSKNGSKSLRIFGIQNTEDIDSIRFLADTLVHCGNIEILSRDGNTSTTSSFPTQQWLIHTSGQCFKVRGHGVKHIYEVCEVEKTSNISEKWRHMIFSYAVCSLLWNEFNGNKEGPIGVYPQRRNQCVGSIRRHGCASHVDAENVQLRLGDKAKIKLQLSSGKLSQVSQHDVGEVVEVFHEETGLADHCRVRFGEYTYLCKKDDLEKVFADQLEICTHPGKKQSLLITWATTSLQSQSGSGGDILSVAYNHNVLFSSTVDHAEERLIDSLYKHPTAFVQKSHSEILEDQQKIDVEKHMQHISVYTSLEPCQQCSGKFHVALIPEVVFCQRDWDIQLMQVEMYEKFRKTRSVPASHFNFPPYEQLATSYYEFQRLIDEQRPSFCESASKKPTPAKKTMPYFLCTDDCQSVVERGDFAFRELLKVLFTECNDGNSTGQDALDKLVVFHGLSEESRSDWYENRTLGNGDIDFLRICNYRPALNHKHQRILHDETCRKTAPIHQSTTRNFLLSADSILFKVAGWQRQARI
jgi:tRNA(Arg) A34 adenosine deaminase TadA